MFLNSGVSAYIRWIDAKSVFPEANIFLATSKPAVDPVSYVPGFSLMR